MKNDSNYSPVRGDRGCRHINGMYTRRAKDDCHLFRDAFKKIQKGKKHCSEQIAEVKVSYCYDGELFQ
jgi:hypothetical protein